jgi:hypothetical protein
MKPEHRLVLLDAVMAGITGAVGAKLGTRLFANDLLGAVVGGVVAGMTSLVVARVGRRRRMRP